MDPIAFNGVIAILARHAHGTAELQVLRNAVQHPLRLSVTKGEDEHLVCHRRTRESFQLRMQEGLGDNGRLPV